MKVMVRSVVAVHFHVSTYTLFSWFVNLQVSFTFYDSRALDYLSPTSSLYQCKLKEVDLHTPKLSKEHTKHKLSAHLSTSAITDCSPLVSSK